VNQGLGAQALQAVAQAQSNAWHAQNTLNSRQTRWERTPTISVVAGAEKIRLQIARLIEALPVSICSRITRVDFYPAFQEIPMKFVVVFDNSREVEFDDVDAFPSDEHIAHIALACP